MAEAYEPRFGVRDGSDYYIKVNLPDSVQSEFAGNGEGVWVIVDEQTCRDYDENVVGGSYRGRLDNDSLYYPGLKCGTTIPFEMRGESRPVVPYGWLNGYYGPCKRKEAIAMLLGRG